MAPTPEQIDAVMAEAVAQKRSSGGYFAFLPVAVHVVSAEGPDHVEALTKLRELVTERWGAVVHTIEVMTGRRVR